MKINNPSLLHYDENGNIIGLTIIREYSTTVAGGAGLASVFLTSNGLTLGGGNSLTFTNVRNVLFNGNVIQALAEAAGGFGYDYVAGTGLLRVLNLESATVVLAGQALEVEENATVIKITVIGD
jgi:hypothetical protein